MAADEREEDATALSGFGETTRDWFVHAFGKPTRVQSEAWEAIRSGISTLVVAPTGSGKTLAAFLHAIDRLFAERSRQAASGVVIPARERRTQVLYISPLKALGADVRKNLEYPLAGIAALQGDAVPEISVGIRTGDTAASERAALIRRPPDILITTPESLYLMLTSKARETLREVGTVIVDEIHAVAGTKRGSHLALSLERLDMLLPEPAQRIGLSATVRPVERVAAFLAGARPVQVVNPPSGRGLDLQIVVPVEDMADLPVPASGPVERTGRAKSIWFHVEAAVLERVLDRRSTIVFVNARGLAERLTARLNELYADRLGETNRDDAPLDYHSASGGTGNRSADAPVFIARSHHGSVSKERRAEIEQSLKSGQLRCVVATSSLELGIDMGQVDLVIQVASPPSVSSGLQRVGRSGHQVGGTPCGLIYPRTRRELIDAAVTVECMLEGRLEAINPPRNPLDILAQQTVAAVSVEPLDADAWYDGVRRSDPFRTLSRLAFDATLDMLSGRFPSDEFAEFRPRIVWDRASGRLTARPGAQRLAVVNGGTIPDRGTYRVVLPEGEEQAGARRVGELDEEMVYESRVNDVITLGASSWRICEITTDQVVVTPAPGKSARLPFWRGEGPGRAAELGQAVGAFLDALDRAQANEVDPHQRLRAAGLDHNAAANLLRLVEEQRAATGVLPTDRRLVVERCRDELGDWRVMLHSPYGKRVHAPWALAVGDMARRYYSVDAAVVASDDGIVVRIPDTEGRVPGAELFEIDPEAMQRIITGALAASSLFAARFRECASRALLLPRRMPGRRSPLWQQRLRAGQLLEVARAYPDFPILLETARECLQDVYDLPALQALMQRISEGRVSLVEAATDTPSPFAANLLFGYVGEFMYADDAPLAERRASVLSLDPGLLADLLGDTDFSVFLDSAIIERVSAELQRTASDRRASGLEGVADLLRELGPLSTEEVALRLQPPQPADHAGGGDAALRHLTALEAAGRVVAVSIAGEPRWAVVEDASRLRDALGVRLPERMAPVFLEPVPEPLLDLLSRYARTRGPFTGGQAAARFGLGVAVAEEALHRLEERGRLLRGNFGTRYTAGEGAAGDPPRTGTGRETWLWEEVFRRLRARSLKAAREATRPVEAAAYARQLLERQYVVPVMPGPGKYPEGDGALHGLDGVARVIEQLAGVALPASLWESRILPARIRDYVPGMLDQLLAGGEVIWSASNTIGDNDGLIAFHLREFAGETVCPPTGQTALSDTQEAIIRLLSDGGAYFAPQLIDAADIPPSVNIQEALWGLVWAGLITADTLQPLRALVRGQANPPSRTGGRRRFSRPGHGPLASGRPVGQPYAAVTVPTLSGRWSLLPAVALSDTARALAMAEALLDRYGVVTRGAAVAEKISGGFASLHPVYRSMEDAGRLLRGRFVKGLGAAQFAEHATIDRLREDVGTSAEAPVAVISALDPANPFGQILAWPPHPSGIRPTRHAGALVAIRKGELRLWLSQGGRQLLGFTGRGGAQADLEAAITRLAATLKRQGSGTFTIESVDGQPASSSRLAAVLREAGFAGTPRGLCWYGGRSIR